MKIGIDAHIILPQHKRYDRRIAEYTEQLITHLLEADKKKEHTWVLFFDSRMKDTKKFEQKNVEIKHFPFVYYRQYLPVVYSHMLISAFIRSANVDVFHSPEGLIPLLYPGKIVTSFHYVPKGERESNLFVRTFMLGARTAFAQLCKRAKRIIVNNWSDKKLLHERHGYPEERIIVLETENLNQVDWPKRTKQLMKVYQEVADGNVKSKDKTKKEAPKKAAKKKKKK